MDRRHFIAASSAVLAGCMSPPPEGNARATADGVDVGNLPRLTGFLRTNWSKDPYALGAYSYLARGSGNADREIVVAPLMERVFFAGEAMNPRYQSTVHAAYESGQQAADAVSDLGYRRIGIVGAGISGLGAAYRLAEAGHEVTVFEARDRIGGRIWSDRSLGASVDLGATWIHGPKGNPIAQLAEEAALELVKTSNSDTVVRRRGGKRVSQWFMPGWLADIAVNTGLGTEPENLNSAELNAAYARHGLGYKGPDLKFVDGYDGIFPVLEGNYDTRLSSVVSRLAYTHSGVSVETSTGVDTAVDAVIVTVPLGVLKAGSLIFDPPLPVARREALARMGMGTLDKVYLLFEEPFWDTNKTTILTPDNDLPRGQFNYWLNFHKYLGLPIIAAFNSASAALALSEVSDEQLIQRALQTLALAYPA